MHISGSQDERELRKINGRFAKKINNHISFKLSGSYLHAYEWEFISEDEWKSHQFAWNQAPNRAVDKKDNNPWNAASRSSGPWLRLFRVRLNALSSIPISFDDLVETSRISPLRFKED